MKNVLFIFTFLSGISASAMTTTLATSHTIDRQQKQSKVQCKRVLGEISCVKNNDALLEREQYYCFQSIDKSAYQI